MFKTQNESKRISDSPRDNGGFCMEEVETFWGIKQEFFLRKRRFQKVEKPFHGKRHFQLPGNGLEHFPVGIFSMGGAWS